MTASTLGENTGWMFQHGRYSWGEWWKGTKKQLQAAGIGVGATFPGEPGAPKKKIRVLDWRGIKVNIRIGHDSLTPEGVYRATSPYVERARNAWMSEDGPVYYADGVKVIRSLYRSDIFRGDAASLVACGLIADNQLPGRRGRGAVSCSYLPDGTPKGKGNSSKWTAGTYSVKKISKLDRFEIEVQVSEQEEERRKAQLAVYEERVAREDLAARHIREALTASLLPAQTGSAQRKIPAGWRVITNPNPPGQ